VTNTLKVSLIFPVYGKPELLLHALETLHDVTVYDNYETILVDDCSNENMDFVYKREDLYDTLIILPRNTGNSTIVVNKGIEIATGELIQYQNTDVYFEDKNWLNRIVNEFDEKTGVVGPALLYPNRMIQSAGFFINKYGLNMHYGRNRLYDGINKTTISVPMVTGCGLTTRMDLLKQNNGFPVYYPYGWDDLDWCLYVKKYGYNIKVCRSSYFYHLGTVSYSGRDNKRYHHNRKMVYKKYQDVINDLNSDEKNSYYDDNKKIVLILCDEDSIYQPVTDYIDKELKNHNDITVISRKKIKKNNTYLNQGVRFLLIDDNERLFKSYPRIIQFRIKLLKKIFNFLKIDSYESLKILFNNEKFDVIVITDKIEKQMSLYLFSKFKERIKSI